MTSTRTFQIDTAGETVRFFILEPLLTSAFEHLREREALAYVNLLFFRYALLQTE